MNAHSTKYLAGVAVLVLVVGAFFLGQWTAQPNVIAPKGLVPVPAEPINGTITAIAQDTITINTMNPLGTSGTTTSTIVHITAATILRQMAQPGPNPVSKTITINEMHIGDVVSVIPDSNAKDVTALQVDLTPAAQAGDTADDPSFKAAVPPPPATPGMPPTK